MPSTHHLLEDSSGDSRDTLGLPPAEGHRDRVRDENGLAITLAQMPADTLTNSPRPSLLAFWGRDLLEQCSFTGGRQSSLAMSVFLMVRASST